MKMIFITGIRTAYQTRIKEPAMRFRLVLACVVAAAAVAGYGCGDGAPDPSGGDRLRVVAAENVWGSIAAQLGGDRVSVTSMINNPSADPHAYEPKPADGRAVASAAYVIVN